MIDTIEKHVDTLIKRCAELESEAAALRAKEESWVSERAKLVDKNEKARARVEAIINHLKNINTDSEQRAS